MDATIRCGRTYSSGAFIYDAEVVIQGGRILRIGSGRGEYMPHMYSFPALTLLPGFIDIHTHGAGVYRVMDCEAESIAMIARRSRERVLRCFAQRPKLRR